MADRIYFIDVDISKVKGELYFNDVPLINSYEGGAKTVLQVNQWVINGSNNLSFKPQATTTGSQPNEDSVFSVRLGSCQNGVVPGDEPFTEIANLKNSELSNTTAAEINSPFPRWSWEDADLLDLSDQLIKSAYEFVSLVHDTIAKKDLGALQQIARTIFDEIAPAYGVDPMFARESFRKRYGRLWQDKQFRIKPIDITQFSPRLCAASRLLEVRLANGRPVLQQEGIEVSGGWLLPMFIGQLDGEWRLLRS